MLDSQIVEQLKEVFASLEKRIDLVMDDSDNPKQPELEELLSQVAAVSSQIGLKKRGGKSPYPRFSIQVNGEANGISFGGIPGGHEFTSLILAILNSDHKGKLPDRVLIERIKALKGPIELKTYISLSCENCPDVVQALNIMAIYKSDFSHQMIDGEFVPDELKSLGIQGVPAVIHEGRLISSGKATLASLIDRLEKEFGKEACSTDPIECRNFDVTVIGAGPAGTSAAIYTARKGFKTAVITDRVGGQLHETKGIENFISIPYTEGRELSGNLHKHIAEYDIEILENRQVLGIENRDVKTVQLNSNETVNSKAVIIATGAKWRELGVEGEKEYLGRGVAYCPHCDGPFYKGKDVAVIGGGNSGVEAAIDLAGIVRSVTVIEYCPQLRADQVLVKKLESLSNVNIITNAKTERILGDGAAVTGLEYEDRTTGEVKQVSLAGVFVQIGLIPNSKIADGLVEVNSRGEIVVDRKNKTSVPGIYAAGDVTDIPFKQIVIALGEGSKAGLTTAEELMLG